MADVDLSVMVGRSSLGLTPLDINDHVNYSIAPGSFGGQVTWQRQSASSPFMDDDVTVFRHRGKVTEAVIVEVFGSTLASVQDKVDTLIQAVTQDQFDLSAFVGGVPRSYSAEAADYQMSFVGSRFVAKQIQVTLSIPRSPIPRQGVL